jgi:NAD(P)H-dependent flavin oxidoreductase YrpB (nitropropane dioxygenase family)
MSIPNISNRFTQAYNVRHPFVSAGMAFFGTAELAIAVIRAGGIGSIGVGPMSPNNMRAQIRAVRAVTDGPLNVNFISFMASEKHLDICIEEGVPVVSFHWGAPDKNFVHKLQNAKIKLWQQVGSVDDARKAVDSGIDVLIAQGNEAGGHNLGGLPTFVLVPEIVEAVHPTMVLAAGGITTGRQVAAALCLGADGVWVGTRLVATPEAYAHVDYKAKLVAARGADTILDSTFGPEWPFFNPMRLLETEFTKEYKGREHLIPGNTENEPVIGQLTYFDKALPLKRFTAFLPIPTTNADIGLMPQLAGQGVGLIHEILPAGEVVKGMMEVAADTLGSLGK